MRQDEQAWHWLISIVSVGLRVQGLFLVVWYLALWIRAHREWLKEADGVQALN